MTDAAEQFRSRLSTQLRTSLVERDLEAVRTLRCVMAAIDNAGAIPLEEAERAAATTTEAPRRPLSEREIAAILQAEIAARRKAADQYAGLGNSAVADQHRIDIATIEHLTTLLG